MPLSLSGQIGSKWQFESKIERLAPSLSPGWQINEQVPTIKSTLKIL